MKKLEDIFKRILELSNLIVYDDICTPIKLRKIEKKVNKHGISTLLEYQEDDNE